MKSNMWQRAWETAGYGRHECRCPWPSVKQHQRTTVDICMWVGSLGGIISGPNVI